MTNNPSIDKRQNKSFIVNNRLLLKQYALKNYDIFGQGVIVVNLLLLATNSVNKLGLIDNSSIEQSEPTVHQPVSYIPKQNFWFKIIGLKIKKKYQIDIQAENNFDDKFLIIFIKDASIENFSIYSIKVENSKKTLNN
ncbi:MAG TPA: hypothetical protein V6C71_04965 [Coleofasciculaceae cyanobacterium]|jgi:hypothetical protein